MAGKHRRIVQVHGDDTYERIWDLVRLGAVVSVEFVMTGDRQIAIHAPLTNGFARTAYEIEQIESREQKMTLEHPEEKK